jgi:hypothetical protein
MIAQDHPIPACRFHLDRALPEGEEYCYECIALRHHILTLELAERIDLLAKHLSTPAKLLVWPLTFGRFASTHPHLLREAGLWQASYLLSFFGEKALTGLATYFSNLGDDLRERADRRDRATRLAVAERDQTLRELYPPERYAVRRQQEVDVEKLEDLL